MPALDTKGNSMKRAILLAGLFVLVFSVGLFAQGAAKDKKVDVTGTWELSMEGPDGPMTVTAVYKQEGEKLTGTQASPMGGEDKLEGTVKDNVIQYTIHVDMGGQQMAIPFTGKVDGDTITGSMTLGEMGSMNFTAKRKK